MTITRRILAIGMAFILAFLPLCAYASEEIDAEIEKEYFYRAAILRQFFLYVKWAGDKEVSKLTEANICVLGNGPILKTKIFFDETSKKTSTKYNLIKIGADLQTASQCHIVYVSSSEKKNASQIIEKLRGQAILTVSDLEDFAEQGGMISMVLVDNKLKNIVNKRALDASNMSASPDMLELAYKVIH